MDSPDWKRELDDPCGEAGELCGEAEEYSTVKVYSKGVQMYISFVLYVCQRGRVRKYIR